MATLIGAMVGNKNVLVDKFNVTPLIQTEEEDQFVISNVCLMRSWKKLENPFQENPMFTAPKLLGDMENNGLYIWEAKDLKLYDSSGKPPRSQQTDGTNPNGKHGDTAVDTEIEVCKFTLDLVDGRHQNSCLCELDGYNSPEFAWARNPFWVYTIRIADGKPLNACEIINQIRTSNNTTKIVITGTGFAEPVYSL